MKVYCHGCNNQFSINDRDLLKINELSTPETFCVKLDNFRCISCLKNEPAYKGADGKLLIEEREKMKLDVDTLTNNE